MNRQFYNYKIIELFKDNQTLYTILKEYIDKYPQQRFGQIICNYIYPDYRDYDFTEDGKNFMNKWFNISFDPFFEESKETYERLCLNK